MDRISQLPDDILVNLLSKLEMKNAAQTSILSKMWRYLWTMRSELDFEPAILFRFPQFSSCDTSVNKGNLHRYLNWVNQVVSMHRGPCLNKFRVCFSYLPRSHSADLDKWVKFALSKQVEELVLELPYSKSFRFSLGIDSLKHPPCNSGLSALKSLHLSSVDVSKDCLEFILSRCHLLERLFVHISDMESLNVKACNLKYLSLISCSNLKELEINAINLMYFNYEEYTSPVLPRLVFNSVPKLVEADFAGIFCICPYPILEHISWLSKQLTKLSFSPEIDFRRACLENFNTPMEVVTSFPNIKHLTLTVESDHECWIMFYMCFIEACPVLRELKLQLEWRKDGTGTEALELQEVEFEEERKSEESGSELLLEMDGQSQDAEQVEGIEYGNNRCHQHLSVLEFVGFKGCRADVECALDIVAYAHSLKTIICNPLDLVSIETGLEFDHNYKVERLDVFRRRACKLAKIVPPNVKVVVL